MTNKEDVVKKLKDRNWFNQSSDEIKSALIDIPDQFVDFLDDLSDRPDKMGNLIIKKIVSISSGNHFILPMFEVLDETTGDTFEYEFIGRKRGKRHSVRGLVMIEIDGKLAYFVVRKTFRFAIADEIYESIGSIYPPEEEVQKQNYSYQGYLEQETAKIFRTKQIIFDRFYDLGSVYPDIGMSSHKVFLFAAIISVKDIEEISFNFQNKTFNDKNYKYSLELVQADELLNFLGKTNDAHLLAIFGRLQALNVIKL